MDQLSKLFSRGMNLWCGLSSHQQRRWKFLLLCSGAALAMWSAFCLTPKYELLLSGHKFSTRELTTIEAALAQASLDRYRIENDQVRVPRDERAAYVAALAAGDALPLQFDRAMKDELSHPGFFESQEVRRARLQSTQQRELSLILRSMKGIENATVQLDESTSGPFQRQRKMTAMVVVQPERKQPLDIAMIRSIRHLVASSKVDLKPSDVTVTDLETGSSYAGEFGDPDLLRSDEFAVRTMAYQRDWQSKLSRLLGHIQGVSVAVNVELEYESKAAAEIATTEADQATLVLVPSTVGVAIGIPDSFYDAVYRTHRQGLSRMERTKFGAEAMSQIRAQQNARVEKLVRQALPKHAEVHVAELQGTSPPAVWPADGGIRNVWSAADWPTIGLVAVSVGMFLMLGWSFLSEWNHAKRNTQADDPKQTPATIAAASRPAPVDELIRELDHVAPTIGLEEPTGDFHQELTRIVRQDPDAAAAKLAEWIDKAA